MADKNNIDKCIDVLNSGGIVLYPTDTIWGIGCDATNETAIQKIYLLKKRAEKKSMIILLAEKKEISFYAKAPADLIINTIESFTAPLTVIYPEAKNLAANLINEDGTIAIRIVKDDFCKKLIRALGKPIVSTSANISGDASPANFKAISTRIKNGVDFIVQQRRNDETLYKPSRILKWDGKDDLIVIRE